MQKQPFVIRLSEQERHILAELATETGRSRADIIRRIVALAATPTGRAALGMIEKPTAANT